MYRILKYLISGGSAAAINLLALYLLTDWLHVWYLFSAAVSFMLGMLVSFLLHKYWTFDNPETSRIRSQAFLYTLMQLANLALNIIGLYVLVEYLHLQYLLAQFLVLGALAFMSFFLYKILFR